MKISKLTVIIAMAVLMVPGLSQADVKNINSQHLSKRPYQGSVPEKIYNKSDNWEGATLISDDAADEADSIGSIKNIRLHMLGKRPYMENSRSSSKAQE